MANPVISIRKTTTPSETESVVNFGYVVADQTSNPFQVTVYNNYDGYAAVEAANNFNVCVYDDNLKNKLTDPVKETWLQVRQVNYNGTRLDNPWVAIGGDIKYLLPHNSGSIDGADGVRGHYTILEFRVVAPHRLDISRKWSPYICFEYEV